MFGHRMLADLNQMNSDLIQLAARVEDAVAQTVQALLERDLTRARYVVAGDGVVDELDNRIGDDCHRILALYQPVASDLRQVIAVLQMTTDLERVGDLAVEIAERVGDLGAFSSFPIPDALPLLAELASGMVHHSLTAYMERDEAEARKVCQASIKSRTLSATLTESLIAEMKAYPCSIEPALCLDAVVRCLQRIAEHATNLAEAVVFLIEGHSIRHHWEDLSLVAAQ
jgi:phosphate transport system protein